MKKYSHNDIVRDYECDAQGIVNNAVYMNYCEHARNILIFKLGYTIATLTEKGERPVVAKATLQFTYSLRGGDPYRIDTSIERKGALKLLFSQSIFRGEIRALEALFTIVIVDSNHIPIPVEKTIFCDIK